MKDHGIPWKRVGEDLGELALIAILSLFVLPVYLRRSVTAQTLMAMVGFALMIVPLSLPTSIVLSGFVWAIFALGAAIYLAGVGFFITQT